MGSRRVTYLTPEELSVGAATQEATGWWDTVRHNYTAEPDGACNAPGLLTTPTECDSEGGLVPMMVPASHALVTTPRRRTAR